MITDEMRQQRAEHFASTLQAFQKIPTAFFPDYEDLCRRRQCLNQVESSLERLTSAFQGSFVALFENQPAEVRSTFEQLDWNAQGKVQQEIQKIIKIFRKERRYVLRDLDT